MNKCVVSFCDRPARYVSGAGYCDAHGYQKRKGLDFKPVKNKRGRKAELGDLSIKSNGYVRIKISKDNPMSDEHGWTFLHRLVMSEHLGRPLLRNENVHHKNGNVSDNRLENLELWVTNQPSGQRPSDLVDWARQILEQYADDVDSKILT